MDFYFHSTDFQARVGTEAFKWVAVPKAINRIPRASAEGESNLLLSWRRDAELVQVFFKLPQ